jgi:hypothetical protein
MEVYSPEVGQEKGSDPRLFGPSVATRKLGNAQPNEPKA